MPCTAATLIQVHYVRRRTAKTNLETHIPKQSSLKLIDSSAPIWTLNRLKLWASFECKGYTLAPKSISEHLQCFDEADL
jgi:hypothetical protein